jgi:hypothetical protein
MLTVENRGELPLTKTLTLETYKQAPNNNSLLNSLPFILDTKFLKRRLLFLVHFYSLHHLGCEEEI